MKTIKYASSLLFLCLLSNFGAITVKAQSTRPDSNSAGTYRPTPARKNDLVHTKLEVSFDYKKCYLYGKEWVTLKPHFYPTDTLSLDAKGMDLKNISVVKNNKNIPLKFTYDGFIANIRLDKVYHNNETYVIYINYVSKPNELKLKGNAAITGAKGLYFINPDSSEKGKPVQIWTQGETESSSCWFPTIDKPEQKTTSEISMRVPAKYVSLSNGRLVSQKSNADHTRTDTWKMELPHAPYLFMMAVGDFRIYHDHWRGKLVDYYLEPKYAPYAKEIFGETPQMIEFFTKTLGVDYPWSKYAQIVVRDYVSGAMENTTATLHGDYVQQTHRELIDANYDFARASIVHELFHQWFGDLVTCESWSNLTLDESFADFSELLWAEHRYGKDAGGEYNRTASLFYLRDPANFTKNLVRFNYDDDGEVFDRVSYQKGGRIINMLRNYLGDAAFFKGLNIYLKTNAFKAAEVTQLRLALEEASGRDLNWFFNQWYYGAGHPVLDINYKWDEGSKTQTVYISQKQQGQTFKLPFAIDIYARGKKERHQVWMNNKTDTFNFRVASKPNLVNVDGDKILLDQKTDNKTLDEYVFQYFNAPLYMDRYEAIIAVQDKPTEQGAQKVLLAALKDKYYGLRIEAINSLNMENGEMRNAAVPILNSLGQSDENTLVRAAALTRLGDLKLQVNLRMFKQAVKSQSYAIEEACLKGIVALDSVEGIRIAQQYENDNNPRIRKIIAGIYNHYAPQTKWPFIYQLFSTNADNAQFIIFREFAEMTGKIESPEEAQKGIAALKGHAIRFNEAPFITGWLNKIKDQRLKLKDEASAKVAEAAIKEINSSN